MDILNFQDWSKTFKKGFIWGLIVFFLLLLASQSFGQEKVRFYAAGVTCSMCSGAIHKSLSSDKNILKIEPNLDTQEWILEYKTGSFQLESLKKKVEDAGFSVSKVWVNNELILDNTRKKKTKNGN